MPVQIPTLSGVIPEPAKRAIDNLAVAVNQLETQVTDLRQVAPNARVDRLEAEVAILARRVDVLVKQMYDVLNP